MRWSIKRKANLIDDLNLLLDDLCVGWGFCNALRADDLIQPGKVLSAEEFACAILQAEGMNAEFEPGWRRRMQNKFKERYGSWVSEETHAAQVSPARPGQS